MNTTGFEAAGWLLQQDYLTFLAVLGWLTAGLLAWGQAGAEEIRHRLPLKWLAFFCFFTSLDATLDLARMIAPEVWPRSADAILRLTSYGYLLEFTRQIAAQRRWMRLPGWVPVLVPGIAQVILVLAPQTAPVPEFIVGSLVGLAAAAAIVANMEKSARPLLAVAAVLPFLGPGELLRTGNRAAVEGLYGLLVTGEGVAAAVTAAVLAWVVTAALWLHGVLRQRTGPLAGRPEAFSSLTSVVLPGVLVATLIGGLFLVNWSAHNSRRNIEQSFLDLARSAALSIEPGMVARSLRLGENDASMSAYQRVRRQVRAVETVNEQIVRAYLWRTQEGRIEVPRGWVAGEAEHPQEAGITRVNGAASVAGDRAHILGPVSVNSAPVLIASAPILETGTRALLGWLGIDFSATTWLMAQAVARLQAIALVGLFASLVVFFLAHVMLREHEAELLIGKERAEAADRAKDEFLAVMSHEIRTPMHSVLGYSDLLARTALTGAQENYLDTIRSQGRTLLRIVQDILDFSTLRKSSYALKHESVNLRRIVDTAFASIRPLAERKQLRFDLERDPAVPETIRGDGVRIEQILLNLLNNAVKFTDQGGVTLTVALDPPDPEIEQPVYRVRFTIADTGIGIKPEDARRLFQPFTRLDAGDHIVREGTGLGLAIVKRLCELMGGGIELESTVGLGSRFIVRLPFLAAPGNGALARDGGTGSAPAHAPEVEGVVNLGAVLPLRILVADDNIYVRRLLIEYLHAIGYQPEAASSGHEAVSRWQEFDLLMMDLRMPGLDGIGAAERIRAAAGSDTQPWIIGVSATLADTEVERAMAAGMNDFLGKPFFVQSLIEAIRASPLFARRRAEPEPIEPAAPDETTVPAAPEGVMNWMPDLSANGNSEIVEQALAEIPVVLDEIESALARTDLETAGERAHYLKNTIFALRIDPMVEPCRVVLERSHAGEGDAAVAGLAALRRAFAAWKDARAKPA